MNVQNVSPTQSKDPRTLTSLSEILSCLSAYQSEETELSSDLSSLLREQDPIAVSLKRLHELTPQIDGLLMDSRSLAERVSSTAHTAKRVGTRVRSLDEEMGRVREANERVSSVMELKSSLAELESAMNNRDWESAVRHCAKAMSIPHDVVAGPFAEATVPTAEMHLLPAQTLQAAREKLLTIFRQNFEEASKARDSNATSRFFKLFPAVGWEDAGLEAYSHFVVDLVRERAPSSLKASSPFYYMAALTALFESVALIVDQHEPVVTKYYGRGRMQMVASKLLEEVDRVTKKLRVGWEEDRGIRRKLQEALGSLTNSRKHQVASEDAVDPREIDKVLSELAGMVGRWNLFRRFLLESLGDDDNMASLRSILEATASHRLFSDLVDSYYVPLEMWYAQTIIDKAHKLASPDTTQHPITTTAPDDVFYILKAVTTRLLTTGSTTAVEKTLQQLRDVIDRDYISVIRRKLDDVYKTSGANSNARPDKTERENRFNFILLLNDLDVSSSHLERLVHDINESPSISQHFIEDEQRQIKESVLLLSQLSTRFAASLRTGIEQLFSQLVRPKLRNLIPDVYKDVNYTIVDDGHGIAGYHGLPRKRFIKAWDLLVEGYKETFSENNFRLFIGLAVDVIIKPWEKYITSLKYTEFGALAFEQDLRGMTAYLVGQTTFGEIKEKFIRLRQISDLLNLGGDEDVDDYYNTSGERWKVGPHEARAIASLKV